MLTIISSRFVCIDISGKDKRLNQQGMNSKKVSIILGLIVMILLSPLTMNASNGDKEEGVNVKEIMFVERNSM